MAEIRREQPRVVTKTLLLLPDQPIPELGELLINRLEKMHGDDYYRFQVTAELVNRYASAAALERVQRIVRKSADQGSAGVHWPLLCYWLKYAPESGIAVVEKGADQRENGNHADLLARNGVNPSGPGTVADLPAAAQRSR